MTQPSLIFDFRSLESLLDDASPLPGPRLDAAAAEVIRRGAALRRPAQKPVRVTLRYAEGEGDRSDEVAEAFRAHFREDVSLAGNELVEMFRDARRSGLLAIAISVMLFAASEILSAMDGRPLMDAISRGLLILAWVALWHPADLLLYAHFPIRRRRRLSQILSEAEITVEPAR